jgi:hypothetical protein
MCRITGEPRGSLQAVPVGFTSTLGLYRPHANQLTRRLFGARIWQGRSGGRAGPNDPDRHGHPQLVGLRDYDSAGTRRSRGWRRSCASLLAARGSDPESALRRSCVGHCWCASELVGWLGRWARLALVRARWLRIKLSLGKRLLGVGSRQTFRVGRA